MRSSIAFLRRQLVRRRRARLHARVGDPDIANVIESGAVAEDQIEIVEAGHSYDFPSINLRLEMPRDRWILKRFALVRDLIEKRGATVEIAASGKVQARVGALTLRVDTDEEFFILHELYIEHIYDVRMPTSFRVIDVGMNVAFASLLFAASGATAVRSFEPFPVTFERAMENLSLNPALAARIDARNIGLAARDGELLADFNPALRGSSGLFENVMSEEGASLQKVSIGIRDCVEQVRDFIDRPAGEHLVAKIDCEGAEYEILEEWEKAGILPCLDFVVMEWHRRAKREPVELADRLQRCGFAVHCPDAFDREHGMMHAARLTSR
jgi:FkbM family methyltransferase